MLCFSYATGRAELQTFLIDELTAKVSLTDICPPISTKMFLVSEAETILFVCLFVVCLLLLLLFCRA